MGTIPRLPTTGLDDINIRRRVRETINELIPVQGTWTAAIRGSGTAGTYEIATQHCSYFRIGNRVWLDVYIEMAGTITGGGTGDLQITGLPFAKRANHIPQGSVTLSGVDFAGQPVLGFVTVAATSTLQLLEKNDNATNSATPISGLAAGDFIYGSISYEIAS